MTADPKPQHLGELLARLEHVPPADTHLRHAIRIALRDTLRDPAAWTALKAMTLGDKMVRLVGDVMPGLPTKDAADFLTTHLSLLATDGGRLPAYVEHASRYGDAHKTIFEFITKLKPDDLRGSLALFRAYQRGLEQKGGVRFDDADYAVADKLVARGLADADGQAIQTSLEIAAGIGPKGSADAVAAFVMARTGTRTSGWPRSWPWPRSTRSGR